MTAHRSPEEWADYYRARVAFVREQAKLGVPPQDPEGRQALLVFARQWQDDHPPAEDPWSLTALQTKMEGLAEGQQAETHSLKQHPKRGY